MRDGEGGRVEDGVEIVSGMEVMKRMSGGKE